MRFSPHFRFQRPIARHQLAMSGVALSALLSAGCAVSGEKGNSAKKAGGELSVPSFGEWISEAWSRYNTKPRAKLPIVPSPRVFDNRNATRPASHPAWQLANELSGDAPQRFRVPATNIFQIAANQSSSVRIGDVSALRLSAFNTGARATNRNVINVSDSSRSGDALLRWRLGALDSRTAFAQSLPALQNQIARRERNAVENVLLQSLNAQDKARTNIARSLEAALQDDIALARRLNPEALEPYLPSELQALALSNLRLDLLPALDKTAAQENSSNQERVRRDIAIRAALREQELTRRSALKRLREDLPIQLEATKREELQKTLGVQSQRDQELRDQAQKDALALITQDFTAADARLGIVLPARPADNGNATLAGLNGPINNLKRTQNNLSASFGVGEVKISNSATSVAVNGPRAVLKTNLDRATKTNERAEKLTQQNEVLKTLARNDARQWSRISARRDGAWQRSQTVNSVGNKPKNH